MKRYWTLLFAGLFLIGIFTACDNNDDGYSLNNVWVGMGVINKTGVGNNEYNITLDDNSILFPVASENQYTDLKNGERVIAYFTILGEKTSTGTQKQYYVKINALKDVLTKGIFMITPEKEDSIGNDPIHVNDVWLTNNYLNFEMQYYGGNMIHYINLVKDNNAQ
ncbi:MAG: NigD-like C-terminal domain-containing protein, partial [Bacteroidota bacterium]|nr:NigD-like C-terminal domain-containing protein [Bacteroidota bacterium]